MHKSPFIVFSPFIDFSPFILKLAIHSKNKMSNEVKRLIENAQDFVTKTGIVYYCNTCKKDLTSTRWKCLACASFDECDACHNSVKNHNDDMISKDKTTHREVLLRFSPEKKRWFITNGDAETPSKPKRSRPAKSPTKPCVCQCAALLKARDKEYRLLQEECDELDQECRELQDKNQSLRICKKDLRTKVFSQHDEIRKLQKTIDSRHSRVANVRIIQQCNDDEEKEE